MIYDFDVPAIGSRQPDPTRKLVGRPDPAIGRDVAAWSTVRSTPIARKTGMVPMVGAGVLGASMGLMAAIGIGSAVPYEVRNDMPFFMPLVLLGVPAILGYLAVRAVRALGRSELDPKITIYVGSDGIQVNELGLGGLRTEVLPFSSHALFRERYVKQPGGMRTRMQLVSKRGDVHTVSSMVYGAVVDAVRAYRAQRAVGERTFEVFPLHDGDVDMGQGQAKGKIVCDAHALRLELDGATAAPFDSLRCAYDEHTANLMLGFPSGPVTLQLGTIADGPVLIGLLAEKKLLAGPS